MNNDVQLRTMTEPELRVAYNNPRALALYQKLGFAITGLNMNKTLSTSA